MANYPQTTTSQFSNDLVLTNGGNAAIGHTSPSARLDIRDSDNLLGVSHDSEQGGIILKAGYGYGHMIGHNLRTSDYCGVNIRTSSSQTNGMYVDTNGKVGIGTTSPGSKLEVDGGDVEVDDSSRGLILRSPDGSRWRVQVNNSGDLTTTSL